MQTQSYYQQYWSTTGFLPHGYMKPELERLFRANLRPESRCLDVGCGDGMTSGRWLVEQGHRYVGVDVSANAVQAATAAGIDARQIEDAGDLPFADGSFDALVCVEVLEHLFDAEGAVKEMRRVVRPDGIVIATVPNVAYWRRRLELLVLGRWNPLGDNLSIEKPWRDPHIRFFTATALQRLFGEAGFSHVKVGGHGGALMRDLPWIGQRLARGAGSRLYRACEAMAPSLLGYALHVVARR